MVDISAQMVKELRDKSGAAMMDCKKALVEASGDSEKAFEILRQKGVATANKKSSRTASEGLVVGQIAPDGKTGSLIEVNCETDFVARNEEFVQLTRDLAEVALKTKSASVDALNKQPIKSTTVAEHVTATIAKTGENIIIRRAALEDLKGKEGVVGMYVHALGGKMGAIVTIEADKAIDAEKGAALGRDIAMHIVSAKPQYVSKNDIPAETVENERRIEAGKQDLADKKPEMREKIVQGRIDKIFAERCLNEQQFVKDPTQSVFKFLAASSADLGAKLEVKSFSLFILGETQAESNGKGDE
ncbi:MAG: elongation factor Ts [Candidatus Melainabacteria bacterium]|nr:elongation factor Ts [Candidatus Melainabacteria bacterium]